MPTSAEVGSTANSYEILAKLAVGGMAEIFLARGASAAGVSRYVVLKRILRDRATDVHFVRMFLDEARLAAQLQHPNIAQVHDIGRLGESYFFTMEYVHGETVRALLHRAHATRRAIPIGAVMTVIAGAAQGLHHAHDRNGMDGRPLGIVHRDVSPSNLMVSYEGNVKVVDFGVAKASDRMSETRSGTVKGKISYLSPEQCRGAEVDRRSDLFALGIVMWEMLATERLFKRASDFENMTAIVNDAVPSPSSRRAEVPPELDAVVQKLLAKRPDDRYRTGEELVEALEAVAARCGFVMSTSALGRYVRDVFGQRPEPWLEIDGQAPPDGVTVTSQPIPAELAVPPAGSVDHALRRVTDLSANVAPDDELSPIDGVSPGSEAPAFVAPAPSASGSRTSPPVPAARRGAPIALWIVAPAIVIGVGIGIALWSHDDHRAVTAAIAPVVPVALALDAAPPPPPPVPDAAVAVASVDAAVEVVAAPEAPDAVAAPAAPVHHDVERVLAACREHREVDARRLLAAVAPARRAAIASACAAAGTPLEHAPAPPPPPPVDAGIDCSADPLACQH